MNQLRDDQNSGKPVSYPCRWQGRSSAALHVAQPEGQKKVGQLRGRKLARQPHHSQHAVPAGKYSGLKPCSSFFAAYSTN